MMNSDYCDKLNVRIKWIPWSARVCVNLNLRYWGRLKNLHLVSMVGTWKWLVHCFWNLDDLWSVSTNYNLGPDVKKIRHLILNA